MSKENPIWNFFTLKEPRNLAWGQTCRKPLKYRKGMSKTSNLIQHLRLHHVKYQAFLRFPGSGCSTTKLMKQRFKCNDCGRKYSFLGTLKRHKKLECGKPPQFQCPLCSYRCHQKGNLRVHIRGRHKYVQQYSSETLRGKRYMEI
ncbi:zinc finger protein, putative [Pediculus humanus corporis]|uniref:Zinc finger protein, putative n=1 Tax=Pediculus humanus subsp. corporis TaxID=121224 RepID=E0VRH2_PEDHC|nr:zinc finger protein, putative [Pediculus humanus corporis]EEB15978.1 zinc finger protein, putative [Pediculus humanus corporis]